MIVLVCGSRKWTGRLAIRRELTWLLQLPHQRMLRLIHGAAPGADTIADEEARRLNIPTVPFPADWDRYRLGAGPRRNQQMLDEGRPDVVLAFTKDLVTSTGTADMVRRATDAGLPVRVFDR